MIAYSDSNEIVDIIFVLDEIGRNYCRVEKLYRNRYPFRHPNAMQIKEFYYENVEESVKEIANN